MAQRDWIGSMILFDVLQARAKRVVFEYTSIVRRIACCAPPVMLREWALGQSIKNGGDIRSLPVSLVEDNYLVPPRWKRHLFLSESFDFVSNDINTSKERLTRLWRIEWKEIMRAFHLTR